MQAHPNARAAEFMQAIAAAALRPRMVVADVPSGSGYLKRYLPSTCVWLGHEPCDSFTSSSNQPAMYSQFLPLPWPDATADALISLAGLHHVDDQKAAFIEFARVVKPGGRIVISDVAFGSAEADFLDNFVGQRNSTGHAATYIDHNTIALIESAGLSVLSCGRQAFHWAFPNAEIMGSFCHQLFDLRSCTEGETQLAIESHLGTICLPGGGVGMNWALTTIVATKSF